MTTNTTTAPTLRDPNGKTWHPTGKNRNTIGDPLYVPEGVNPDNVAPCFQSTRTELDGIFGTPMTVLAVSA